MRSPAALLALAVVLASCATGGGAGGAHVPTIPVPVDTATVGAWHFDETGGTVLADAGPLRADARAGVDTRTDFGRVRNGRLFTASIESFVYVPWRAALDPYIGFTVEAWVHPTAFSQFEMTPLLGRWNERPIEQSWMLGLGGLNTTLQAGPRDLDPLVRTAGPGYVVFAFQPEDAGPLRAFASSTPLQLSRWTHVAVTYDGEVVKFYIDGRLDAQFASHGRIRGSQTPLLMGNYFDWRWLSEFGGDLRADNAPDKTPYYAFEGTLDEVRLSNVARRDFPYARP